MDRNSALLFGAVAVIIAIVGKKLINNAFLESLKSVLSSFVKSVEGFRPHPYWDNKRYSWGYGTQAPGPEGTITRDQAFEAMMAHLMTDYSRLRPMIKRDLSVNQWAALLSFSYNEGVGAAMKLVPDINGGSPLVLHDHWMLYIYADGEISEDLIERRNKEWELWQT